MNISETCSNTTIGSLFLANFSTASEKECGSTPAKAVMSICTTTTVCETHNLVLLPSFPPSPLVPLSNPKNHLKIVSVQKKILICKILLYLGIKERNTANPTSAVRPSSESAVINHFAGTM